ncbi:MAG: ATP-binding cassette domain-containing protein [Candidatus Tectomicrobia bacterium]|uniref:ATP-binding cassette domain-containing protein n=1 Tax=Tectimicrobiota bacterium TaxID=2528274 RepID=A0A937W2P2_UNCTE|nr:ATP-binding cassette domain-containing protein [Candidatus Tectomicrobia bacterium]
MCCANYISYPSIVGRSGSGKSILVKLIQRLCIPDSGRVLIDGIDIAQVDPAWLRRQIGVVLQENFLFSRSVRANIALADPGMAMERIVQTAQLAGTHEFILELPEGYDTLVGEHGCTLSGGQRSWKLRKHRHLPSGGSWPGRLWRCSPPRCSGPP